MLCPCHKVSKWQGDNPIYVVSLQIYKHPYVLWKTSYVIGTVLVIEGTKMEDLIPAVSTQPSERQWKHYK